MDLSIIIPSFNTKELLHRCLQSIYSTLSGSKKTFEVIVIDNASTDTSISMVKRDYPDVLLIENNKNVGYGKANNQGIQRAKGTTILLLNSDIVVKNNAIETLVQANESHTTSFVGGKLLNEDGSVQSSAGPFFSLGVVYAALFLRGDKIGWTRYSPDTQRTVDWASGACLCGQKQLFLDVGLFDESIFMYMDEVDFLYRARKLGYTTIFCPKAQFIHTGAASSASNKTPVLNIFRGLTIFYRKHYSIMEQAVLRILLIKKAIIAICIGTVTGKRDIVSTYEEALRLHF